MLYAVISTHDEIMIRHFAIRRWVSLRAWRKQWYPALIAQMVGREMKTLPARLGKPIVVLQTGAKIFHPSLFKDTFRCVRGSPSILAWWPFDDEGAMASFRNHGLCWLDGMEVRTLSQTGWSPDRNQGRRRHRHQYEHAPWRFNIASRWFITDEEHAAINCQNEYQSEFSTVQREQLRCTNRKSLSKSWRKPAHLPDEPTRSGCRRKFEIYNDTSTGCRSTILVSWMLWSVI